jgi:hypothetical protein
MKLIATTLCIMLMLSQNINAQKAMTNGSIHYTMEMDSDNPMAAMMGEMNMIVSFKDHLFRTDVEMMGGMATTKIILDTKKQDGLMLMEVPMMGKNIAVEMTEEDMANMEQANEGTPPTFKYFKNKTKKICGYKCYKVEATVEGADGPMNLYVTEQISPSGKTQIQKQLPGLKGFPLSYEVNQMGMVMTITATKVDKKAPAKSEFDLTVPEGYEKMTVEELGKMGGGMNGIGM